jgi:hypothetical protein
MGVKLTASSLRWGLCTGVHGSIPLLRTLPPAVAGVVTASILRTPAQTLRGTRFPLRLGPGVSTDC